MRDLAAVAGFMTPVMVADQPSGQMLNAFADPRDIDRIAKGYGCGNCCAIFTGFRLDCPLCGLPTHVTKNQTAPPPEWQAHVDQRSAAIPTKGIGPRDPITTAEVEAARATLPRTPEEFFAAVAKDKDIEQVPLSKLGPRRNRSAR